MLAAVVEEQGLRATLALVIACARADRIYVAPVFFPLRVAHGVAINFAGRSLENSGAATVRKLEHVDRAVNGGLYRLYGIVLIVDRARRTRKVVDSIHFQTYGFRDVVSDEFEVRSAEEMRNISLGTGEQVVEADHIVALIHQPVTEVRADESGSPGDQNSFNVVLHAYRVASLLRIPVCAAPPRGSIGRVSRSQSRREPTSIMKL